MILRALTIWFAILLLASVNGAVRSAWLIPRLGDTMGRAVSTLLLSGVVFLVTWQTIGWIRPTSTWDAVKISLLWLVLTLAFEFLAGHYVFRQPWPALLEDYDVRRGRIWPLVLVVILLSPLWAARVKGLFRN